MKDKFTFVDLGLPSGRLWASENAEGYYTYDEAKEKFGELLPKPEAFEELYEECQWIWDGDAENKGVTIVGPNKNTIFLPASGFRDYESEGVDFIGSEGNYWSDISCSPGFARVLYFNSYGIDTRILGNSDAGFSVRLCKEQ